MSATKILWGQILAVFAIVLLDLWGATEWAAWRLAFQPELGPPWFAVWLPRLYPPPAFFWWWYGFDAYAPEIFVEGADIAASGGFIAIAVAIGLSVWRAREASKPRPMARRAGRRRRSEAAGLLGPDGVVLGRYARATICVMTARNMCCASRQPAPARASASSSRRY